MARVRFCLVLELSWDTQCGEPVEGQEIMQCSLENNRSTGQQTHHLKKAIARDTNVHRLLFLHDITQPSLLVPAGNRREAKLIVSADRLSRSMSHPCR